MRKTATKNGVTVKAYAGTTGVLLAMNVTDRKRQGLLGFAIERHEGSGSPPEWLSGLLPFPGMTVTLGQPIPTNVAPVQKFRWSDYRVYPETEYGYTVHPVYGDPARPTVAAGPSVGVKTASSLHGDHCILFNRAVAASQAFARKFPDLEKQLDAARAAGEEPALPPEALAWLSRGVREQIVGYIDRAMDKTWALDIAIYEYELPEIVRAVEAAHARGVQVRVVYHAKSRDKQTLENEHSLRGLPDAVKRARKTSRICHHKYIVLSRVFHNQRRPQSVLCGSTNFTHNGVYRQANVTHIVGDTTVAQSYLDLFEVLFRGDSPALTANYIDQTNAVDTAAKVFAGFSPRSSKADLQAFIREVAAARRDVMFCTAFDLYDDLEKALLGVAHDPILRYGLQDKASQISGFHADRTADFAATALLSSGLEGWLKESRYKQRGNILIHTKAIVVDFTSDAPVVISGSHNFSKAASESNDENYLIVRGDTDVADCYGCETLRLYDHYRFRYVIQGRTKAGQKVKPPLLTPDDSWTERYFEAGSLRMADRLRFSGQAV
ncbi:MAG: hypothetical protein JWN98_2452 [Abditibacteriota bacterium]|nr:hypothetical protein [Abditibacteriota bacterium]